MTLSSLLSTITTHPSMVEFNDVINVITQNYDYTPSQFVNGDLINAAGTNEGSCKIFSFALLNQLTVEETLSCFGQYYRADVLQNMEGSDHANIRNFMVSGWKGIKFEQTALTVR